jgi:cell wall-associated NlpC family hydrolase
MLNFIPRLLSRFRGVPALSGKRPQSFRPDDRIKVTRLLTPGQFAVLAAALTIFCLSPRPTGAFAADPQTLLAPLVGTPYRDDGVDDPSGRHTLFADPSATLSSPGLNCSGFVTTASRALLARPLPLEVVKRDRKGDSGPGSPGGQDWDFGYDLIVNISEGLPRRVLTPNPQAPDPAALQAASFRGFPLHDAAAWKAVLPRIRPGELVLATFSKEKGGRLYYYHVGLLFTDNAGHTFLYHATPGRGAHRLELSSPAGMAAFMQEFAEKRFGEKYILLVAVPLPR